MQPFRPGRDRCLVADVALDQGKIELAALEQTAVAETEIAAHIEPQSRP